MRGTIQKKRKTKRPRLDLSLGTFADQPSPKCCSIRRIGLVEEKENGPRVLWLGTEGPERGTSTIRQRALVKGGKWRKRVGVEPTGDRIACRPPVLKTGTITGPHALPHFRISNIQTTNDFCRCSLRCSLRCSIVAALS